ncbi:MAG TPA: ABC transporter permease [Acidimicrobiales bacterium]|nr:ABC transporter permease [Acidimicrobiales bacterium]
MAEAQDLVRSRRATTSDLVLVARAEWRARWRSQVVLVVLTAATFGVGIAALTAASRSESAFNRLRAATRSGDVSFVADGASREGLAGAVRAIPGVEAAGARVELFVRPKGTEYFPDYDLYASAPLTAADGAAVDRPVIIRGRAVRADRSDEVVLSEPLAASLHARVGSRITLESMTSAWVEKSFTGEDPGPSDGPDVDVDVVGLARGPGDFGRYKALVHLAPAFVERYGDVISTHFSVQARLTESARRLVDRGTLPHLEGTEVEPSQSRNAGATNDGLGTIAIGLRLLAAVALLAGAVATTLTLARLGRISMGDRRTLTALGWTEGRLVSALVIVFSPWLVAGVGVGLVCGVLASPSVMIGLARRVDPAPGAVRVEGAVLAVGLVAALGIGLAILLLTARRAASGRGGAGSRLMGGGRLPGPTGGVLGVRYALLAGPAGGGRTSRGAVAVVAAGVAGAVAALVVSASIVRLADDSSLSGGQSAATRLVDSGESVDAYDRALPLLAEDDRVQMLAGIHVTFDIDAPGSEESTALVYDIRRGDLDAAVLRGRMGTQPDEVALGPATLERTGKHIGDDIELRGPAAARTFRITGAVLFPEGDFSHDDGVALTSAAADRIVGDIHDEAQIHQIAFRWNEGVDATAADRELAAAGLRVFTDENGLRPPVVTNLAAVATLPRYLAGFLGLLALVTLGHALVVGVRLRNRETGTLRAIGMTAASCSSAVVVQAATMAGAAVVAGVPVGLWAGRIVWRLIAEAAHVVVVAVTPWPALAVLVAATLVATALLSVVPSWRVLCLRPANVLRSE